ncbi:MAG: branched-chain amino acid ABC transporter permease [Pseudothermotoga sp.]|uniref:branched-chain amino acid ABC transporter permease n=1 Tax=Pseudothermotoga sp. TaxID=2033661 RepID=UPI00076D593C|nr:MAG: Inner-membrane translocator [Thermotoga sp. 50_64]MBC7115711.1 branched-chain amino acid ABC transporter permease [Pseudothermotoga sp.]MDK2923419.1 branched-chain amino acid transport system permease protein [Pseudothermotoga sp.]HCO97692.1 branched-chain amino acid ABC transporter permease [Pseudothermotoga sp.]
MKYFIIIAVCVLCFLFPLFVGAYLIHVLTSIMIFLSLALSWDMMLRTGQLSFGIAGFFGLGAYASIIAVDDFSVHPMWSILIAAAFAALVALALGWVVLRLREIYFAITTLALSSVFMIFARNLSDLTGGSAGKVLYESIFQGDPIKIYWLVLSVALVVVFVSEVFQRTRIRFAVNSIRDDEIAAKCSGVNIFKYLLFVFVLTSAIQGAVGALYAQQYAFVEPESTFSANFLLLPMSMALVGGIYSTLGPVIGAVVLGLASEYLKLVMPYGHLIIYGLILIVTIMFLPRGIYGTIASRITTRR